MFRLSRLGSSAASTIQGGRQGWQLSRSGPIASSPTAPLISRATRSRRSTATSARWTRRATMSARVHRRRYRSVDFGKKVMLPAGVVNNVDVDTETVFVNRTKDEIKNSPEFDPDQVPRRHSAASSATTTARADAGWRNDEGAVSKKSWPHPLPGLDASVRRLCILERRIATRRRPGRDRPVYPRRARKTLCHILEEPMSIADLSIADQLAQSGVREPPRRQARVTLCANAALSTVRN